MAKTKELHFEDAIEHYLVSSGGWGKGDLQGFDRQLALVPREFFSFVENTQPDLWADLRKHHQQGLEVAVLDALVKALDSRGTLDVLRHGFKFFGKKIECAQFKPAHGMNPEVLARYEKNRLVLIRQVRFAPDEDKSVDLVLFVNGLPVATAELKNPLTQQNVHHAIAQYRERDHRHALFRFKTRALVHFAVDPDLVYTTTRLQGKETTFLPFNRGNHGGAGNPEHPSGYRTAYLWQEVWHRDSWLDILGRFVHLAVEEKVESGKKVTRESIVFPRYHQLDVVRKLDTAARADGAGHSYLVQHSAGSGKSNSLSWLAHRLASLHDDQDRKVFDSVVVVTDRKVLDKQLQDNIYEFEHKQGVVVKVDQDSEQLARALTSGTPIIITTLQKFPFVTEKIGKLPNRRYAVIVDEAHSSQTGEAARNMKEVLAAKDLDTAEREDTEDDDETTEDRMLRVMQSRGKQKNLSFFAFTATPKAKTLEIFGHRDAQGKPIPFHLYSMRQAIEEGFILDVLQNYTTYKTFYKLVKATEQDPKVNKKQATSQLARFMSLHPHNLAQKTQVMVEHFRQKVRHKIGGRAKAMVVTRSRLHAVRYKQAFERYIKEQGYDIGVLVAFSGTVQDPEVDGVEYTEVGMNRGVKERELPEKFATDVYQVLLVANKYQTGFDQPLLHTMYVDKRLSGVQAVQTLSRLNRTTAGKTDTFVLDFVNEADEIVRSFQPYYEQTVVADTADPHQLYELQHRLEAIQVFWASEVQAFCDIFYQPQAKQTVTDQAEMYRQLNPACDRFRAKTEDEQDQFRNALTGYVKLYSFLSQVMPFTDPDLERLYTYGRHLELKLPRDEKKAPLPLDGEVALKYYRLEKISEGDLVLRDADPVPLKSPADVGTRKPKEDEVTLSEIIDLLNDRFGTEFTEADQLLFDQFIAAAKQDQEVVERAMANQLDNFELAMKAKVEELMIDRMEQNQEIVTRYLNDPAFQLVAFKALVSRLYNEIRTPRVGSPPPGSSMQSEYRFRIRSRVIEVLGSGSPLTFRSLARRCRGAFPCEVLSIAQELGWRPPGASTEQEEHGSEWSSVLADVESNPLLCSWYFTARACARIANSLPSWRSKRVLFMGCPTLYEWFARHDVGGACALIDLDDRVVDRLIPCRRADDRLVVGDARRAGEVLGDFDVVILDPPWYPEDAFSWLSAATLVAPSGTILMSILPELTRPSGAEDRAELLAMVRSVAGKLTVTDDALEYQVPTFERAQLKRCGVEPVPWKLADLLIGDDIQRPLIAEADSFEHAAGTWTEIDVGTARFFVRTDDPASGAGLLSLVPHHDALLASPSRRDFQRRHANVLTSRGHGLQTSRPADLIATLSELAARVKDLKEAASALIETPLTAVERDLLRLILLGETHA